MSVEHCTNTGRKGSHKASMHPLYNAWYAMMRRCYSKAGNKYSSYGGRGITVCDRWIESPWNFFEDMGEKPTEKHSLDRIDNDKGYYPDNCRWATDETQARNQRADKRSTTKIRGVHFSGGYYRANIRINGKMTYLAYTKDFFEACCARKAGELKYWH